MTLSRILIIFLAITGALALLVNFSNWPIGDFNYWDNHGVILLVFLAVFPRLTLLLGSFYSGGLLWWIGWFFAPHVLVACLATLAYWKHNPVLVLMAWVVALGGESSEKVLVGKRVYKSTGRNLRKTVVIDDDNVIEAEVRHL